MNRTGLLSKGKAQSNPSFGIGIPVLVGNIRGVDDLIEIKTDVQLLAESIISGEVKGHDFHPCGNLVDILIQPTQIRLIIPDGEIELEVDIAVEPRFTSPGERCHGKPDILEPVANPYYVFLADDLCELVVGKTEGKVPGALHFKTAQQAVHPTHIKFNKWGELFRNGNGREVIFGNEISGIIEF